MLTLARRDSIEIYHVRGDTRIPHIFKDRIPRSNTFRQRHSVHFSVPQAVSKDLEIDKVFTTPYTLRQTWCAKILMEFLKKKKKKGQSNR